MIAPACLVDTGHVAEVPSVEVLSYNKQHLRGEQAPVCLHPFRGWMEEQVPEMRVDDYRTLPRACTLLHLLCATFVRTGIRLDRIQKQTWRRPKRIEWVFAMHQPLDFLDNGSRPPELQNI